MIRDEKHAQVVAELFTSAALDSDWRSALTAFADACGAAGGQLVGLGSAFAIQFNWSSMLDAVALEEFAGIDGGNPAVNPRSQLALRAPILQPVHDLQVASDDQFRRRPVFADYCRKWDCAYGSQATLINDELMQVAVLTQRTRSQGVANLEQRRAFETLAPHVLSAVRLQIALEGRGAAVMAGALDAIRVAAFICDGFGQVRALTPAAEAAVARGPLRLRAQRLVATRPADSRALDAAISAAVVGSSDPGRSSRRTLVVRDDEASTGFEVVEVAALPSRPHAFGFDPRCVVTLRRRPDSRAELTQLLREVYALTPAEAEVVACLAEGDTRDGIAGARLVSLDTVRMQIKRAFAKMNVRREAELFALISRLR